MSKFIELTSEHGPSTMINLNHIVGFWEDPRDGGVVIRLSHGKLYRYTDSYAEVIEKINRTF